MLSDLFTKKKKSKAQQAEEVSQLFSQSYVVHHRPIEEEPIVQPQSDPVAGEKERAKRTLFVGNIDLNATVKHINKLFSEFGEVIQYFFFLLQQIEKIWFRSVPVDRSKSNIPIKAAVIIKKFQEGSKSKNCYILFKTKESAKSALKLDGTLYKDLHIRCDLEGHKKVYSTIFIKPLIQQDCSKTVFVGNLPFNIEEEDLRQAFSQFGEIDYVRVIKDQISRQGKGFGYVSFKVFASFKKAIEPNVNVTIQERQVRITKAQPDKALNKAKPKQSSEDRPVTNNQRNANQRIQRKQVAPIQKKIKKTKVPTDTNIFNLGKQ